MKFKLVEKWIDNSALPQHYEEHKNDFVPPFYDMYDYEEAATKLAKHWPGAGMAKDPDSTYVGYISQNGYFNVYNKVSNSIVVFRLLKNGKDLNEEPLVISYYPLKDYQYYLWRMDYAENPNVRFKSELPHNQAKAAEERTKAYNAKVAQEEAEKIERNKEAARQAKIAGKAKYDKKFNKIKNKLS